MQYHSTGNSKQANRQMIHEYSRKQKLDRIQETPQHNYAEICGQEDLNLYV